jgi:hypothetical protein
MNMDSPTSTGAGGYISILLALDNVFNFAGDLQLPTYNVVAHIICTVLCY